jgi:hypothetical protein
VISWQSVLLVEETGVPGENYWPVTSRWQTLSHSVVSSQGNWIYNYLCNRCLSPLKLWVLTQFMARCTWYNAMW